MADNNVIITFQFQAEGQTGVLSAVDAINAKLKQSQEARQAQGATAEGATAEGATGHAGGIEGVGEHLKGAAEGSEEFGKSLETANKGMELLVRSSEAVSRILTTGRFNVAIGGFNAIGEAVSSLSSEFGGVGAAIGTAATGITALIATTAGLATITHELGEHAAESVIGFENLAHAASLNSQDFSALEAHFADAGVGLETLERMVRLTSIKIQDEWGSLLHAVRAGGDEMMKLQLDVNESLRRQEGAESSARLAPFDEIQAQEKLLEAQAKLRLAPHGEVRAEAGLEESKLAIPEADLSSAEAHTNLTEATLKYRKFFEQHPDWAKDQDNPQHQIAAQREEQAFKRAQLSAEHADIKDKETHGTEGGVPEAEEALRKAQQFEPQAAAHGVDVASEGLLKAKRDEAAASDEVTKAAIGVSEALRALTEAPLKHPELLAKSIQDGGKGINWREVAGSDIGSALMLMGGGEFKGTIEALRQFVKLPEEIVPQGTKLAATAQFSGVRSPDQLIRIEKGLQEGETPEGLFMPTEASNKRADEMNANSGKAEHHEQVSAESSLAVDTALVHFGSKLIEEADRIDSGMAAAVGKLSEGAGKIVDGLVHVGEAAEAAAEHLQHLAGPTEEGHSANTGAALAGVAAEALKATAPGSALGATEGTSGFSDGGYITGPGTGTSDSIRAPWLSNGEYVIPASRVSEVGVGALDAFKDGKLGFADGGLVQGHDYSSQGGETTEQWAKDPDRLPDGTVRGGWGNTVALARAFGPNWRSYNWGQVQLPSGKWVAKVVHADQVSETGTGTKAPGEGTDMSDTGESNFTDQSGGKWHEWHRDNASGFTRKDSAGGGEAQGDLSLAAKDPAHWSVVDVDGKKYVVSRDHVDLKGEGAPGVQGKPKPDEKPSAASVATAEKIDASSALLSVNTQKSNPTPGATGVLSPDFITKAQFDKEMAGVKLPELDTPKAAPKPEEDASGQARAKAVEKLKAVKPPEQAALTPPPIPTPTPPATPKIVLPQLSLAEVTGTSLIPTLGDLTGHGIQGIGSGTGFKDMPPPGEKPAPPSEHHGKRGADPKATVGDEEGKGHAKTVGHAGGDALQGAGGGKSSGAGTDGSGQGQHGRGHRDGHGRQGHDGHVEHRNLHEHHRIRAHVGDLEKTESRRHFQHPHESGHQDRERDSRFGTFQYQTPTSARSPTYTSLNLGNIFGGDGYAFGGLIKGYAEGGEVGWGTEMAASPAAEAGTSAVENALIDGEEGTSAVESAPNIYISAEEGIQHLLKRAPEITSLGSRFASLGKTLAPFAGPIGFGMALGTDIMTPTPAETGELPSQFWPKTPFAGVDRPSEFADGGHIRGPGTGTSDEVPIWASNGEFVLKADAVKHWGLDRVEAWNEKRGFAEGGVVSLPSAYNGAQIMGQAAAESGMIASPFGAPPPATGGFMISAVNQLNSERSAFHSGMMLGNNSPLSASGLIGASATAPVLSGGHYALDVTSDHGTFSVMANEDMMSSLSQSALASKLTRTGITPSWGS